MVFNFHYNSWSFLAILCQWLLLFSSSRLVYPQEIFTATIVLTKPGTQFIPVNMAAQLISFSFADSIKTCNILCTNNVLCRVYDYEVLASKQCRLFEGDTNTLGEIVPSLSSQSEVGTVQLSPDLFAEYGQKCVSSCYHSRYLQCNNNSICECMPHTYWNSSIWMCIPQSPILGASCQQNMSMCREDLNYTCLQFNQCGPLSVLSGTTIMDNKTIIIGNATAGLNAPKGISVFGTDVDSLAIVDLYNNRIVGVWDANGMGENISVIATEWAPGQSLCFPYDVYIDSRNGYNLYVSDICSGQVILYSDIQSVNSSPSVVAGTRPPSGSGLQYLNYPYGIAVDSHYNVMVASWANERVVFWPPNATVGTVIVGLSIVDNTSMGLYGPSGIAFDEQNSLLYVADTYNHRIQRYSINSSWPCNGTTVAGKNGPGIRSDQLFYPNDVWVSKKTGAMYIADSANNRIQLWYQGATEGVTIAGDPNGNAGVSSTMLADPVGIAVNTNETYVYVTDMNNNRVQRFQLI